MSDFSGLLQIHLSSGKIKLSTKNATYSFEEYYTVFEKGFQLLNFNNKQFKEVLILGFGLGSVPILLEKVYHKKMNYTGIEIDPAIIELVKKYMDANILQQVNLIEADAYEWINQSQANKKFDLIIIDLFIDHITAPHFFEPHFLKNTTNHLTNNGLLLFNTLTFKSNRKQMMVYFNQTFQTIFPNAKNLKIGTNYLLSSR